MREVFERCRAGESAEWIASTFAARGAPFPRSGWNRARVHAVTEQTAYRGEWVAHRERGLTIATPRIVSDALWFVTRDRDAARARQLRGLRKTKHVYLVEAIATCGVCGGRILIQSANHGIGRGPSPSRYVCERRRWPDATGRCTLPYWLTSEADDRVWSALRALVVTPERLEHAVRAAQTEAEDDGATWERDLAAAERRVTALARAEAAILARFRRGAISETAMDIELGAAARERAMAQQQVEAAQRARLAVGRRTDRTVGIQEMIADLRSRVEEASPKHRRELALALIPAGGVALAMQQIEVAVSLTAPTRSRRAATSSVSGSS